MKQSWFHAEVFQLFSTAQLFFCIDSIQCASVNSLAIDMTGECEQQIERHFDIYKHFYRIVTLIALHEQKWKQFFSVKNS